MHETFPEQNGFGPWNVTKAYEQGKSGDDWLATKIVSSQADGSMHSYQPGTAYYGKINGKQFFDLIQPEDTRKPGEDTVFAMDAPPGTPMKLFEKNSPEHSSMVNLVHYKVDFDACKMKEPMIVQAGEGYFQTIKRSNPDFTNADADMAAHNIKKAMGNKDVLKVGQELKE